MIAQQKKKVLVVDDETGFTKLLKLNLEETGKYEVFCENDAVHALDTAHYVHPDIVLLDIVMPGKDGGDVAHEFEDDPELGEVPVVFVTALVDNEDSHGTVVRNSQGQQLLGKPFRFHTLCDCIDTNTRWERPRTQEPELVA